MLRHKPALARFARLMCWVLLLLPLMQTAGMAHELGHLNDFATTKIIVAQDDASSLARNGVCDACLAFSAIASGITGTHTDHAAAPQQHLVWQAGPLPRFVARSVAAYASRAPPRILA
jgi:hypothetical protein